MLDVVSVQLAIEVHATQQISASLGSRVKLQILTWHETSNDDRISLCSECSRWADAKLSSPHIYM
jgi:hypothetical protein